MRMPIVAAIAVLGLAGCKDSNEAAPSKPLAEVAQEAGGLPKPVPGLYRSTVELVAMEAPGLPPPVVERMKESMAGESSGTEFCLTGAEAEKGYEERVRKLSGRPDCAFVRYSATAGQLDAQLTCKGEGGIKSVLSMKGAMTPTRSDVTMRMDQSGNQMPGGGMSMTMRVKSERVGDCPS